ncbi:hypothetical protein CH267_12980 [Rhodococcus sp. 06-621-2]|nr:hypothetical protein CH267_12980 [Rhodococcus sp. 06-621-2]
MTPSRAKSTDAPGFGLSDRRGSLRPCCIVGARHCLADIATLREYAAVFGKAVFGKAVSRLITALAADVPTYSSDARMRLRISPCWRSSTTIAGRMPAVATRPPPRKGV